MIQLLLQHGANPNAKFRDGKGVFNVLNKRYEGQQAQEIRQLLEEAIEKEQK